MLTSLVSLFRNIPVRPFLAMTGEITLRGEVLPVGGIKEKVLAARRAKIKTVILPELNKRDLEDINEAIRKDMQFVFVTNIKEVFKAALIDKRTSPSKNSSIRIKRGRSLRRPPIVA